VELVGNSMSRARMWCFTLFGADDDGDEQLSRVLWLAATQDAPPLYWKERKSFKYMKYQVERAPDTGRLHIQGFVCLTQPMRMAEMKRHYSGTAHWEVSRGSLKENEDYCGKEESRVNGPFEAGTRPEGGASKTRDRWLAVQALAKQGLCRGQILMEMPELAPQYRGIDALIESIRPPFAISREITVFYIYGPTGVGKTHHALTQYPNAYLVRGAVIAGKSFDQYRDETELILDEWSPFEWPLTLMNSLLDKWKCPLMCRYQNTGARWTTVVITSNVKPEDCYTACLQDQRDSFLRRVTYRMELTERVESLDWDRSGGVQSPPGDIPDAPTPPNSPSNAPTPLLVDD